MLSAAVERDEDKRRTGHGGEGAGEGGEKTRVGVYDYCGWRRIPRAGAPAFEATLARPGTVRRACESFGSSQIAR